MKHFITFILAGIFFVGCTPAEEEYTADQYWVDYCAKLDPFLEGECSDHALNFSKVCQLQPLCDVFDLDLANACLEGEWACDTEQGRFGLPAECSDVCSIAVDTDDTDEEDTGERDTGDGDTAAPILVFETIGEDLDSPRGITCGEEGTVYVALAGKGQGTTDKDGESYMGADGRPMWFGNTGSVIHIDGDTITTILSELPSAAANSEMDASVWLDACGPSDILFDGDGTMIIAMGMCGDACTVRDSLTDPGSDLLGTIMDESGTVLSDLADHECVNNTDGRLGPDQVNPDYTTNPFRLMHGTDGVLILDAGANAIFSMDDSGVLTTVESNFPDQMQTMPDLGLTDIIGVDQTMIGLPPGGATIGAQPVPSGFSMTRDGSLFVGELTGMPFVEGSANVYRLTETGPEVDLSGYTTIVDIAHDDTDSLYILEYATTGFMGLMGFTDATGALTMVTADGATMVDDGTFIAPAGLAICNGDVYVSDGGGVAGAGRILKGTWM